MEAESRLVRQREQQLHVAREKKGVASVPERV